MSENGRFKDGLKDSLKKDFDIDVNVSTGLGQSRNAPVVILDTDPPDASLTEMNVLKGIGIGRGAIWRVLSRTVESYQGNILEQVKIESKIFTETEIETLTSNYYFDISNATSDVKSLPNAVVYVDTESGLNMPFDLGFLHYQDSRDYEINQNGLGLSLAYGINGLMATIYIYDLNIEDIPLSLESTSVFDQLSNAVADFKGMHPDAEDVSEGVLGSENIIFIVFSMNDDTETSLIGLSTVNGKFIKIRLSYRNMDEVNEIAQNAFSQFEKLLESYRSVAH